MSITIGILSSTAEAAQEIGKLSYVEGRVDRLGGGAQYLPVVKEETVALGDIVRTKSYSRAEIIFADQSVLRLGENSQVQFKDFMLGADGSRQTATLHLGRGKIRATVAKTKDQAPFIIETPNASGTIKGSDMFVSFQKSSTAVLALEGKMALRNLAYPDKVVELRPLSTAVVGPQAPPSEPRPFAPMEQRRLEQDTSPRTATQDGPRQLDASKALVSKVTGDVLSRVGGSGTPGHRVQVKEVLGAGSDIETGPKGAIEIVLESGRIVQLQPNSKLTIKKLSRDPKTGAREDLFESTMGKIRVSVEKLRANSKFEIKTPTAIAGVRGTVMYLNILPTGTTVFFEGGTGYIGNGGVGGGAGADSGSSDASSRRDGKQEVKDVGDGQNASVDAKGKVSDPIPTVPEQRQSMERGWDPQAETFGYTDPEPQRGAAADDTAVFFRRNEERIERFFSESSNDTRAENLFDQEPPKPIFGDGSGSGSSQPTAISLTLSGSGFFGSNGQFTEDPARVWSATLSGDTNTRFWNGAISAQLTLSGSYTNANPPAVWWKNVSGLSSDGGRIFGRMGGSFHSWEGSIAALTIDPSRRAGVAFASLSGTSSQTANGTFTGSGPILNMPLKTLNVVPGSIATFVQEGVLSDGLVEGHFGEDRVTGNFIGGRMASGATLFLNESTSSASQRFGVLDLKLGGSNTYGNPLSRSTWSGLIAGGGAFGRFASQAADSGYWAIDIENGVWSNGVISGGLDGAYLTYTQVGTVNGKLYGVYDGTTSGSWSAVGLGVFQGEAVDFSGKLDQVGFTKFNTATQDLPFSGNGEGLLGGIGNIYRNGESSDIALMGRFSNVTQGEPLLWGWDFDSYNVATNAKTTSDGGAFTGSLGGSWVDRHLSGFAAALFINPTQRQDGKYNAGILSGAFAGEYAPDSLAGTSGLWALTGDWESDVMGSTAIAPAAMLLEDPATQRWINIEETNLLGTGVGRFAGSGTLQLQKFDGNALRIKQQPWGMWRAKFGGLYATAGATFSFAAGIVEDPTPVPPNVSSAWLTTSRGAWTDAAGTTFGDLAGQTKGVWISISETDASKYDARMLQGTFTGNHQSPNSSWQGIALGEWQDIAVLDQAAVGYTMNALQNFVSIPISEKYSSLLGMAGSFNGGSGAIAGAMDASFYSSSSSAQGIWAGIFNGAFTGLPQTVSNWSATVAGTSDAGAVNAALSGLQWANGQWLANIASTPGSAINFTGQAGGTYAAADASNPQSGTFEGVGTGNWSTAQ